MKKGGEKKPQLHETNGGSIDFTSWGRLAAVAGSAKVTKYHSKQHHIGKGVYLRLEVRIGNSGVYRKHRHEDNMTDIYLPVSDEGI